MTSEAELQVAAIESDPVFQNLVARRSRLAWILSALMLVIYFGFILLVAFAPQVLGTPLGKGVMTLGIPIGIFVIVSAFLLTAHYVLQANTEFDDLTSKIVERAKR